MADATIKVASDFSRYPAGRYEADGPYSGQAFRTKLLEPLLRRGDTATVDLDGTRGYGSSFLEEAFGGLVRTGFTRKQILSSLTLKTEDASLEQEIKEYIEHGGESA